ncbi:uncharacterized protein LOC111457054 [Cucurbita moschata]|uniref:Uncharacterized protein LOC111457054 n=1 Tax=Cucurbita moschata TaxID=3662 RepID=A0A6J1GUH7_CUCMO|nr:uncharacterized protein LOC111457054 [Cucurbita moschata]
MGQWSVIEINHFSVMPQQGRQPLQHEAMAKATTTWQRPPTGHWKLNIDASWIAKQVKGPRIVSKVEQKATCSTWKIKVMDLAAILEGLKMLVPTDHCPVLVELDSIHSSYPPSETSASWITSIVHSSLTTN